MKHIRPYNQDDHYFAVPSREAAAAVYMVESVISAEYLDRDISILDKIESMIPESLKLDFELDMFINRREGELSAHHRELSRGNINIYESLSKSIPREIKECINEIVDEFKKITIDQKRKIFEAIDAAEIGGIDMVNTKAGAEDAIGSENFMDVAGEWLNSPLSTGQEGQGESRGLWSKLKGFFSAITEGGSPIGIFQFILDIIGLVGDFTGTPIGIIADSLNAIIYAIRGKWLLAILSAIAAIIPVGGSIVKGWITAGSKSAKGALEIGTTYFSKAGKVSHGVAEISPEVIDLAAKASPASMQKLDWISRSAGPAVTGLVKFIKGFFDEFLAKIVGWIPGLGKPLSRFFEKIGETLGKLGRQTDSFIKDVPKITTKAQAKQINNFFKLSTEQGAKITTKGEDLIIRAGGKTEVLSGKVLANSEIFFTQRYGKNIGKKLAKGTANNVRHFYSQMATVASVNSKYYGKTMRFARGAINTFTFTKKIPLFIGRQVIKWVTGEDPMNFTEDEAIAWGSHAMNQLGHDRRDRNLKENPDAFFDVPLFNAMDDEVDTEYINTIEKMFNDHAEIMNLPRIGHIAWYTNGGKDKLPKEVEDYYRAVDSDIRDQIDANMAEWQEGIDMNLMESRVNGLKHIMSFKIV